MPLKDCPNLRLPPAACLSDHPQPSEHLAAQGLSPGSSTLPTPKLGNPQPGAPQFGSPPLPRAPSPGQGVPLALQHTVLGGHKLITIGQTPRTSLVSQVKTASASEFCGGSVQSPRAPQPWSQAAQSQLAPGAHPTRQESDVNEMCLRGLTMLPPKWGAIVHWLDDDPHARTAREPAEWWARATALSSVRHIGHNLWVVLLCAGAAIPLAMWRVWAADWGDGGFCSISHARRAACWIDAVLTYLAVLLFVTWRLQAALGADAGRLLWRMLCPAAATLHLILCAVLALFGCNTEPWGPGYLALSGAEFAGFALGTWALLAWNDDLMCGDPVQLLGALCLALLAPAALTAAAICLITMAFAETADAWVRGLAWRCIVWHLAQQAALAAGRAGLGRWPAPLHSSHAFSTGFNVVLSTWGRLMVSVLPTAQQAVVCSVLAVADSARAVVLPRLLLAGLHRRRAAGAVLYEADPELQTLRLKCALAVISDWQAEALGVALAAVLTVTGCRGAVGECAGSAVGHMSLQGGFQLAAVCAITIASHRQRVPVAGLYCEGGRMWEHCALLLPLALIAVLLVLTQHGLSWLRSV